MKPPLPSPDELQKLALYELLDLLEDIQQPEPVSYLPATPLWSWIFGVGAVLVLLLLFLQWKRWQRERYRKIACDALKKAVHLNGPEYAARVSQILKRTALTAYPRVRVASLVGKDWLCFLDETCKKTTFTQGVGKSLASEPFQRDADFDKKALTSLSQKWVRHHRREEGI